MVNLRKFAVILCLLVLLWTSLTPAGAVLSLALLEPFWLFITILVLITLARGEQAQVFTSDPYCSPTASRAPPSL